jgi:hypothetical protein
MAKAKPAKRKTTPSAAPAPRPARTAAALPPAAAPAPRSGKRWGLILGMGLLAVALVGQGVWVYLRNVKAQAALTYMTAVAPRGQGKAQVEGCRAMAVDEAGDLYHLEGVNEGSVLQKFSAVGQWKGWTGDLKGEAALNNAFAVAAGRDGSVWVVERGSGLLKRYSSDLKYLGSFKQDSTDLTGVAVDPKGQVWVAAQSGQVFINGADGQKAGNFAGDPDRPWVHPFRLCFDAQGRLFVIDLEKGFLADPVVKAFSADGKPLACWTAKDLPATEFISIGWDPQGFVALNDTRGDVANAKGFQLYAPDGRLKALAPFSNNGQSLRAIPGFCINGKGQWILDMTPLQQGCALFTLPPLR